MKHGRPQWGEEANVGATQERVQGGACPPPQKLKSKKKGHQSKFEASSPIFGYFFSRKYHFLTHFLSWASPPPPKILKSKKKKLSDFGPPPLRIPGHAPDCPPP